MKKVKLLGARTSDENRHNSMEEKAKEFGRDSQTSIMTNVNQRTTFCSQNTENAKMAQSNV